MPQGIPVGTWVHVAVVHDYVAKTLALYYDGTMLTTGSIVTEAVVPVVEEPSMWGSSLSAATHVPVSLDNLQIYTGVLTAKQIHKLAD